MRSVPIMQRWSLEVWNHVIRDAEIPSSNSKTDSTVMSHSSARGPVRFFSWAGACLRNWSQGKFPKYQAKVALSGDTFSADVEACLKQNS